MDSRAVLFAVVCCFIVSAQATSLDGCLSPTQQEKLHKAIKGINIVFDVAFGSLEAAAILEKNATIKHNLELAATVIGTVNQDLVNNFTHILDSPCATCSQITDIVNQTVVALEETLTHIMPTWRANPIFKAVVTAVDLVFQVTVSSSAVVVC